MIKLDIGPIRRKNVQANFLKQELRTQVTDMKRMPVEDSNLPTLDVNWVTKSGKLETLQLSVPVIYIRDETCTCWYQSSSKLENQAQSITVVNYD